MQLPTSERLDDSLADVRLFATNDRMNPSSVTASVRDQASGLGSVR
ncbi:MAG: hypothetical protein AB7R89_03725 [Dehalococcoidia bacterium]